MRSFLWLIFLAIACSSIVTVFTTGSMLAFGLAILAFIGMVIV